MTFTTTAISVCDGGEHYRLTLTVNGTPGIERSVSKTELKLEDVSLEELVVARLRSAVKEAGATTPAQMAAAILNQEFQV